MAFVNAFKGEFICFECLGIRNIDLVLKLDINDNLAWTIARLSFDLLEDDIADEFGGGLLMTKF